jgi:hypothetical protein
MPAERVGLTGSTTMRALAYLLGARALDIGPAAGSPARPVPEVPMGPLASTPETASAWRRWRDAREAREARGAAAPADRQQRSPGMPKPAGSPA